MVELYNLTNPQKSIWNMEKFFEGTTINNICASITILDKLDKEALKKAIYNTVIKNDSFRIRITTKDNIPMQYISEFKPFEIEIFDLKKDVELKKIKDELVNYKFNIIDSDLFCFKIAKFEDGHGILVFTVHHIIADSWSLGLFAQNLMQEYNKLKNGEELLDYGNSYLEYINSENSYKQSKKYQLDKEYWEKIFETIPEQASFPSNKEVNKNINYNSKRQSFRVPFNAKIKNFCEKNKVSNFNFFMAIYSIYLSKISGLDEFVIGTPILNRTNFKEKQTMGMFVNTIPVKISLKSDEAFSKFANNLSLDILSNLKHQKYSYSQVLEDLRNKNSNISTLYNIVISYQITKAFNKDCGNYTTDWYPNNYSSNDCTIQITDINDTGEFLIHYDYLSDKYTEDDIINIHNRINFIIEQILNNEEILINAIDIVTPTEKTKILYDFNNTKQSYLQNKSIIELFEEQVLKTPNNTAIVFGDEKLTYKELNEKANSIGFYLRNQLKVKPNDLVGIIVDRSLELIISIIGVLKAGSAYIPIDPAYPEDRINYMLDCSKSNIILTKQNIKNNINVANKVFVDLDNEIYNNPNKNLEKVNKPDDLIYVIFTSGSTGKPKGVMLTNKNINNFINSITKQLELNDSQTIVSVTTVSFDIFVLESLLPLLNGLKIIIANEEEQTNIELFNKLCLKNNVNIIQTTPSRMELFISNNENYLEFFKNITKVLIGGEPFSKSLLEKLKKINNFEIYNMYGPTETAVWSSFKQLTNTDNITIGKPIYNTQFYILNKDLKPLPIGVIGDLYISGDGVSKGYLNRPDLTSNSFIPNPFIQNSIIYKTGDLGKYQENGEIVCLGRSDNQVKLRGLRIELEEIENSIQKNKEIKSCVVIKKTDENNHEFLCAYYTTNSEIDSSLIRRNLEKNLPKYMIPNYLIELKELPYTPNGKIDRKKLPEPEYKNIKHTIILPKNKIDEELIEILKSILKLDNISMDDSLLDLGGDSLSAITLSMAIQNKFNIKLLVKDILDNPKISDISNMINKENNISIPEKIKPVQKADFYQISSAQKRIYLSSKIAGNNSVVYNIAGGLIFERKPDINKIQNCFDILIKRHEAFRTYFEIVENNIVQKIVENVNFNLEILENVEFSNIEIIFKNFVRPFDLSKAPLLRAKFIEFTNNQCALFVDMHHIISDGTSLQIFAEEFCKLYNDQELEKINITYKDFSEFENNRLQSDEYKDAEKYWLNQFKDEIPVLNMPTNYQRPIIQNYDGERVSTFISSEKFAQIENFSKSLNSTPYTVLLSIYYILLSKYTSENDIVIGSPIVGRDLYETQNIIGMFVNTLALRNKIDSELSFNDFFKTIKDNVLEAFKNQIYPFDELVNKLGIKRDSSRNPLFNTMFIYQNNGYGNYSIDNIKTTFYTPTTNISKFDLSLEIIPDNGTLKLFFEYATSLFSQEFIENFAKHYLNILDNILKYPDIKISEIDILTEYEKNKILNEFNDTTVNYTENEDILDLFEQNAFEAPNNTAIVFENQEITYRELNEKANSLANFLIKQGITKNDFVAILLNRSPNIIISVYAVIKAGASYVIIDKDYPEERINYILEDSKSKFTITDKLINNFDYSEYDNQNLNIQENDRLCIIYTSGSTGKPKGVLLHKYGYYNLVNAFDTDFKLSQYKRILGIATVSFDMFAFEMFASTILGNTLILANNEEQKNPIAMSNLIKNNDVEFFVTTPSRVELLLTPECGNPLKNVKAFLLGGEKFTSNLYNRLQKITDAKIFNSYGPTEITSACTNKLITSDDITVGKPLPNTHVYICDSKLNLLPIGVVGEICVGGKGVTDGYLNNEDATKAHFVKNPFDDGLIYRTGDLARFRDNGEIEYIDRLDDQVKIRGLRIELGEIEALMLKYPNIKKAIVIKQVVNNREFLSSYYISNKKISHSDLRKYLSKYLPNYMVPSYYTALNDFKYTQNGKIDKKSLPIPTDILSISKENYIPPKTELQKKLVKIWEEILNTKPIGVNDNFFELGGDSLLAMNLNMELLKITKKVSYSDLFNFPTILELERKINSDENKSIFNKIENLPEAYQDVLDKTIKKDKIKNYNPNGILLTGATGFLGIHVLEDFLTNTDCNIYCIIREQPGITVSTKLLQKMNYYFGNKYDEFINKRIFAVSGDISNSGFGLNQEELLQIANSIDVVIHCAANVAHFGNYKDFYKSNVISTKYIIDFCKSFNKKLYHISTTGIGGTELDLSYLKKNKDKKSKVNFNETSLYIGQLLDNVYTRSKFEAENCVLDAINSGLDAYILRMGNLMPRYSDGNFQENIQDNAFLNKFAAFIKAGIMPEYMLKHILNFTPIDYASNAVFKLVMHPSNTNRVFHIYNNKNISVKKYLKKTSFKVKILSEEEFVKEIKKILENDFEKDTIKNLIDDFDKNLHLSYVSDIITQSKFTTKYLRKIDFKWPKISKSYIKKFDDVLRRVV